MPSAEDEEKFLEHALMVRDYASGSRDLSETDTRVHLIDPVLEVLGYRKFDEDIRREVTIPQTKERVDYELRAGGKPQAIVEAKALHYEVNDQDVAQCIKYASLMRVRWCLITNGASWKVYDEHAGGKSFAEMLVAEVRLDKDEKRAWSVLQLFSQESLSQPSQLTELLVERVVLDELLRAESPAIAALGRAVKDRFREIVSPTAVAAVVRRVMSSSSLAGEEESTARKADAATQPARTHKVSRSGLLELIDAGLLPSDAPLECTLYGKNRVARVRDGAIELEGKMYATPSAAASALRDGKASNGWVIWKYKGELLADIRAKLAGKSQEQISPNAS